MSVKIMHQVWERSIHGGSELLLMQAIADFADDDGHAYPSVPTLARKIRMSERNTRYLLVKLKRSGELEIVPNGPRGCNRYWIRLPAAAANHASLQRLPAATGSHLPLLAVAEPPASAVAAEPSLTTKEPSVCLNTHSAPKKSTTRYRFDEEDELIAKLILDGVRTIDPRAKANLDIWANEVRLIREQDGRAPHEIRELFQWANADTFWRANVLSPAKLRQKWTALVAKRAAASRTAAIAKNFKGTQYGDTKIPNWASAGS